MDLTPRLSSDNFLSYEESPRLPSCDLTDDPIIYETDEKLWLEMEKERQNIVKMIESEFFLKDTNNPKPPHQTPFLGYEKNHASSILDESFNKQQVSKSTAENPNFPEEKNTKSLGYESEEIEFHDSFSQGPHAKIQKGPKKKLFKRNVIDDFSDKEEDYPLGPKCPEPIFDMEQSPINESAQQGKMSFHDGSFNY
jgi:hypothetical protein